MLSTSETQGNDVDGDFSNSVSKISWGLFVRHVHS